VFYDTFQDALNLYFMLEFIAGGDLRTHLSSAPFELPYVRTYAAELLLALRMIHSQGIVHRDLKPENIMFAADGRLTLIDFGVATQLSDASAPTTCFDLLNGWYSAPEVWKVEGYRRASDWWAFEVIIFEMLAGRQPHGGTDERELMQRMGSGVIDFPDSFDECTRNLMRGLMAVNWEVRLGAGLEDAQEIMRHPWFADGLPRFWFDVEDRSDSKYFPECSDEAWDDAEVTIEHDPDVFDGF
jgi:serine/threonine protein kinase